VFALITVHPIEPFSLAVGILLGVFMGMAIEYAVVPTYAHWLLRDGYNRRRRQVPDAPRRRHDDR
jgi:hypothetical protein